jgi:hypothetical protein
MGRRNHPRRPNTRSYRRHGAYPSGADNHMWQTEPNPEDNDEDNSPDQDDR